MLIFFFCCYYYLSFIFVFVIIIFPFWVIFTYNLALFLLHPSVKKYITCNSTFISFSSHPPPPISLQFLSPFPLCLVSLLPRTFIWLVHSHHSSSSPPPSCRTAPLPPPMPELSDTSGIINHGGVLSDDRRKWRGMKRVSGGVWAAARARGRGGWRGWVGVGTVSALERVLLPNDRWCHLPIGVRSALSSRQVCVAATSTKIRMSGRPRVSWRCPGREANTRKGKSWYQVM